MTTIETAEVASPIGRITLAVRDGCLCALDFTEKWSRRRAALEKRFGQGEFRTATDPAGVVSRLERYFAGDLGAPASIRVDPGGTAFRRKGRRARRKVPPRRTAPSAGRARGIAAARPARAG